MEHHPCLQLGQSSQLLTSNDYIELLVEFEIKKHEMRELKQKKKDPEKEKKEKKDDCSWTLSAWKDKERERPTWKITSKIVEKVGKGSKKGTTIDSKRKQCDGQY